MVLLNRILISLEKLMEEAMFNQVLRELVLESGPVATCPYLSLRICNLMVLRWAILLI
jgi:hypothetical protein